MKTMKELYQGKSVPGQRDLMSYATCESGDIPEEYTYIICLQFAYKPMLCAEDCIAVVC